jgi:hypothetical protein
VADLSDGQRARKKARRVGAFHSGKQLRIWFGAMEVSQRYRTMYSPMP